MRIDAVPRVVIFAEPEDRDDAEVVKSLFSTLTASPGLLDRLVIAEVCGTAVARSLSEVFGSRVVTVNSNEILALVLAQAVREQGMGQLIDQLTSYRGGEFYDHPLPAELEGKTFGEVAWRVQNAAPIGFARGDRVRVLPALDTPMAAGDMLIVVDRLLQPLRVSTDPADVPGAGALGAPAGGEWSVQQVAIIGWNTIVARSVEHLRGFLGAGSRVVVMVDRGRMSVREITSLTACGSVDEVTWTDSSPEIIEAIRTGLGTAFDAVAIVPYRDALTASQSDATRPSYRWLWCERC